MFSIKDKNVNPHNCRWVKLIDKKEFAFFLTELVNVEFGKDGMKFISAERIIDKNGNEGIVVLFSMPGGKETWWNNQYGPYVDEIERLEKAKKSLLKFKRQRKLQIDR